MTERKNEVYFYTATSKLKIVGGSYTIKEYSITNGQDPNGNISVNKKVDFGSDRKMVFSIGRKGTKAVAEWFNNRIPANKTTFEHTAGELKFAFIGDLVLKCEITDKKVTRSFFFQDVALAQGHEGTRNNWWFG